jgi:hypothetical protein
MHLKAALTTLLGRTRWKQYKDKDVPKLDATDTANLDA